MSLRARSLTEVKAPRGEHIAFDAAEPEFDLIEPRGIGRSKMQVQLGMIGQELCDPLGLMGREVVGGDVDLASLGLQRSKLAQEGHKLLAVWRAADCPRTLPPFAVSGQYT